MKAIFTLLFVLTIGVTAQAQNTTKEIKVETVHMTIVTTTSTSSYNEVVSETKTEVARLYKFKNSRIKKALSFTTKRNRAKRA